VRSRWAQVNVVRSAAAEAALVALGAEHVVNTSKPACVPTLLSQQSSAACDHCARSALVCA
jgi:hypothetical protein